MGKFTTDTFLQDIITTYTNGTPIDIETIVKHFQNKKLTDNGKVSQLSSFKKILKNIRETPELFNLRMDSTTRTTNRNLQLEQRNKLHEEPISISKEHQKLLLNWIKSDDIDELYTALLFVSGRRPTEIYLLSNDLPNKGNNNKSILFKHQLKKRQDHNDYQVPLLVTYSIFKKALQKFKILSKNIPLNSIEIYEKFHKKNGIYINQINEKLKTSYKSSDFRRLYTITSFKQEKKNYKGSYNQFISMVLGHESITTSLNYSNVV